jgi:hypothetical protein
MLRSGVLIIIIEQLDPAQNNLAAPQPGSIWEWQLGNPGHPVNTLSETLTLGDTLGHPGGSRASGVVTPFP